MTTTDLAPALLAGDCEGAAFEITMLGHMVDKPYKLTQTSPNGLVEEYWYNDLGVAARAATRWLSKYYPIG